MERPIAAFAAAILLAALPAHADQGQLTEAEWFDDLPQVLAGSRLAQTVADAPVAISVIDREMIEASGIREIQDLMRLVPGMLVHHDNGHHATVTYRVLADTYSRRMLVLIDGRPAYSPVISHVNWTMLPITVDDVERIEVIRGPHAAAFGANAMLGVISITTRRPHLAHGVTTHATLGNNGIYRGAVTVGDGRDEFDWRITLQASGDHGYSGPFLDGDDKETALISARADWRDARGMLWEVHGGWADGRRQHGGHNQLLRPPHHIYSQNGFAQLNWRSSDDPLNHHALNAFWTLDSWDQTYLTRPVPALGGLQGLWELSVRGERAEVEYQRTVAPQTYLRSAWGVAARIDRMGAPGYLGRPDSVSNTLYRAFSHHEIRFSPHWVGNLGVMLEHDGFAGTEISPRGALNWSFAPGHVLRASASRATRTPTIVEENADHTLSFGPVSDQLLLASGGLDAERIRSYELGWIYGDAARDLTFDARVFRDRIDRLITYFFVPFPDLDGVTQDFRNFDKMDVEGFEAQVRWRPTPAVRLLANHAYQDIAATDVDEVYSASGPRHISSAFAEYRLDPRTFISLTLYRIGSMEGLNTGTPIERHERADFRIARDFRLRGTRARLSLTVQEPLGDLRDFRTRNEFHRRWFVDLRMQF